MLGGLALAAMVGLALYGPLIAAHDPFETNVLFQGRVPPYDPSPTFPLGTDAAGRDRLSLLLWGARNTFLIAFGAAAFRLAIGAFLGVFAAWQGGAKELWLARLALGLSSVPATIAALMAVIAFNVYAGPLAFILALGMFGWGDAFHQARRAARTEAARPFIETARSLGMSEERVVMRHLVPNLAPTLLTVGALQVSAVLLLLGELALLRVFVGGALTLDLLTAPLRLPTNPEWASLLGTTRPIFDLYGNTIAVLAPAGALLAAVVSINLFADALAQRAQRLDVFRLVSRRTAVAVGLVAVLLVLPVALWPSRLAPELHYADGYSSSLALAVAAELADPRFEGRVAQSSGAAAAAALIADRLRGELVPINEQIVRVTQASLRAGSRSLTLADNLGVLTPRSTTVSAPLVFVDFGGTIGGTTFNRNVAGRIAVVSTGAGSTIALWESAIANANGLGLIVLSDNPVGLFASEDFPLPTVRTTAEAFRGLLGTDLPTSPAGSATTLIDVPVTIAITAPSTAVGGVNVIARVPGSLPAGPLVVVVAPYDAVPAPYHLDYPPAADSGSATGVLAASIQTLRASSLAVDVVYVAAGSEMYDHAGLKSALGNLTQEEGRRLVAVISIPSALSRQVTIRSDPESARNPTASFRIAGRVANALGERSGPQFGAQLVRAVATVDPRAATFELSSPADAAAAPTADTLRAAGRSVAALLAYIANHPEDLR